MTESKTYEELPIAVESVTLPYLPIYRRSSSRNLFMLVLMLFTGVGGGMAFLPEKQPILFTLSCAVIVSAVIMLGIIGKKVLSQRRATTMALNAHTEEFLNAVSTKYNLTLTQTILYQLAQGSSTLLMDKNNDLRRIMLDSSPETRTTKLVAETF